MGGSAFVTCTDGETVLKGYQVWEGGKIRAKFEESSEEELSRENQIYELLGEHPQILKCFGLEEVHTGIFSLRLELASLASVREYIETNPDNPPPLQTRSQMALDVATGIAYIHSRGVWHSDISCRNFFLFSDFRVKIGDFGGSLVQGQNFRASVCEEPEYELPCRGRDFQARPRIKRELFALGTGLYEIIAWARLFPGSSEDDVDKFLSDEKFPPLEGVLLGNVIHGCWNELYNSAEDVVRDISNLSL